MKIYFLSSRPCALMLGGVYFGMTDSFERFAEIEPKDNVFAEFIPEGALPVGFFITEKLRFSPPQGCEIYILRDGVAVYARDFPPSDFSFFSLFSPFAFAVSSPKPVNILSSSLSNSLR